MGSSDDLYSCMSRDNSLPRDRSSEESISRASSVDLVEYCLQLLDRYSLTASLVSLNRANSHRSLRREGSLNDVTSLSRDVTSLKKLVTSREGSVSVSVESESPGVSSISSDSYSPECLLQTFYVCSDSSSRIRLILQRSHFFNFFEAEICGYIIGQYLVLVYLK